MLMIQTGWDDYPHSQTNKPLQCVEACNTVQMSWIWNKLLLCMTMPIHITHLYNLDLETFPIQFTARPCNVKFSSSLAHENHIEKVPICQWQSERHSAFMASYAPKTIYLSGYIKSSALMKQQHQNAEKLSKHEYSIFPTASIFKQRLWIVFNLMHLPIIHCNYYCYRK
jgi:hypothetical protein